jgi:hypothetical protein
MIIKEDLTQKAAEIGEVKFSKSVFTDPHIKKTIAHISKATNKPSKEIIDEINKELQKFKKIQTDAPILYHTIAINVIEGKVFNALKKIPVKGAPELSVVTFTKLLRFIKQEHRSLFPMRNFVNHKALHNPRYIFVPSKDAKEQEKYGDIDTAAATPNGEFIFNTEFMQELLNFAHLKGIKPKSKKYSNNKGDIPPEYAYIEFLIMHEFMHYTYADFHYADVHDADPTIANWVGDFRSNYDLVKGGQEQLPIGLYNDLINMDRQKNWKQMYDIVKSEFDKLSKEDQDGVKGQLGDIMNGDHVPGEPGKPTGKTAADAEAGAGTGRGKGNKDEDSGTETAPSKDQGKGGKGIKGGRSNTKNDGSNEIDYTKFSPTMSWKALISKLIKTAEVEEETYQKMHRRGISRIHAAAQLGAAAVQPGEISLEGNLLKLVIVVDSSGSMSSEIEQIYSNINNLLTSHASDLPTGFVLVKFSDDHKMFLCDVKGHGSFKEISSLNDKSKTPLKSGSLKQLFSEHYGSGTNFNESLTGDLQPFINDGYNVLIVSDTDIIASGNKEEFNRFYKHGKGNVYLIAANRNDYHAIIAALKDKSSNITHM